jgi:phenylacetate-coenzyme A ligase PaaK-like adenylate-forming protein
VPLVTAAGTLVLISSAVGFEFSSASMYTAAKAEVYSQQRRDSLYDSANTKHHISQAFAVSGLTTGGVALWLYLRNRKRGLVTSTSTTVVPIATGLTVSGWF